jgi:hypothetical protein
MASVSIGQLFLAGVIPGIIMGVTMMLTVAYFAYTRNYGRDAPFSALKLFKAGLEIAMVLGIPYLAWRATELGVPGGWMTLATFATLLILDKVFNFSAVMALLTPVLLIGGMTLGVFTPTEGAIAASLWALFLVATAALYDWRPLAIGMAVVSLTAVLNQLRTLVAHLWVNEGEPMTVTAQFLDSVTVPPPGPIAELWAPVGLRYHALHHMLPSVPYHSLPEAHRRLGVNDRRVEHRHRGIRLAHQQSDLGTAEDDRLGAAGDEIRDHAPVRIARGVLDASENQLLVDHAVHLVAIRFLGDRHAQAMRLEAPPVELLPHRESRAQQADRPRAGFENRRRGGIGHV